MRSLFLACSLLLLPAQASALCRCTCVEGTMRPICQQTDLVVPICQGLCTDSVRPPPVARPIAGGQPQLGPIAPANPSPGGLQQSDPDLNSDPRGYQLGTPGQLTGAPGASSR